MAWFDDLELPGATIKGRFAFVTADGPDEDENPDLRLASGHVTLTPTAPAVRIGGAWIGIEPVTGMIFDGELVIDEEDLRPIRILSTDADTGVQNWGWKATFNIAGAKIQPTPTFKAPTDATVVLTGSDLIPVTGLPVEVIAQDALDRLVTAEDLLAAHEARLGAVESTVTVHEARLTAVESTVDRIKLANVSAGEGAPAGAAPVGWRYIDLATGDHYRMEA